MNILRNLTLATAIAITGAAASAAVTAPDILIPNFDGAKVIQGLSNNGKYGVASMPPGEDGFSYTIGAVIYDLTGSTPKATNIAPGKFAAAAFDVTDDGQLIVGSVDNAPAVCRFVNGEWKWEMLPLPDEKVGMEMYDSHRNQYYIQEFELDGGEAKSVTPDGKYAVGLTRSNENIMIEQPIMWDLTTMKMVPLNVPKTNLFGEDDHMSRFLQLSDDANYILGWNSFSYPGYDYIFVYDRKNDKMIYPFYSDLPIKRYPDHDDIEIDGFSSKSLTSDGHYVTGRIRKADGMSYAFLFDVWKEDLVIYDDGVHQDTYGWSVSKDGMVMAATPADTPYADALIYYKNYMFPVETLLSDVYDINLSFLGIDNTGKPTLVSEDSRTIVFVNEQRSSYVVRFHEPLTDALNRINLMSSWSVFPVSGTKMTKIGDITFTFNNPIEGDKTKYGDIKLLDSKGATVASAKNVTVSNMKMTVSFPETVLNPDETYTLILPEGACYVKGQESSTNEQLEVKYVGRANVPVKMTGANPSSGTSIPSLDLNDNPIVVTFDAAVKINGTADNRPIAHLYVDDQTEPAASLNLDVDQNTNRLVIFPSATYYLYKGAEYRIEVPQGTVVDLSGAGPSEAFTLTYHGSYVPQLGDEIFLFQSECDSFDKFLFYEGDHGTPVNEYAEMNFTADTTPWWVVRDNEQTTDMAFASHSVYTDGRQSYDWVTTRQIRMPEDVEAYLSFQSQSYRKNKKDYLKVYVYEDNKSYNSLTADIVDAIVKNGDLIYNELQSPGATEGNMEGEWTDNAISLAKYKGKNIYICFLNDNQNQSMVMIDNIQVKKDVSSFITITSPTNVIDVASAPVKGIITIESELAHFSTVDMTLLDSKGNTVSTHTESGLSLTAGDMYKFEFPKELPLVVGEENEYTIRYKLDEDANSYDGVIRDLAFAVDKKVIIEEFTGRDCQFCPLGIAAMNRLESLYGEKIIPVILHCYNSSDPKGANMIDYASTVFMGNGSAPNGRINRRPNLSAPMYESGGSYHMTAADVPGTANAWQDDVVEELNTPTYLSVDVTPRYSDSGAEFDVTVTSALNLKDQNIRALGVLLEDNLYDFQSNGVFNISDPLLGEFGKGGAYGQAKFLYYFNNVARGYWGSSPNGTPRVVPSTLEVGKEYKFDIIYYLPRNVENNDNLKFVVMLLDENTGRVINATVSSTDLSSVEEITDEASATLSISKVGSDIVVSAADEVQASVYTLDGRMLKQAYGNGTMTLGLDGYKGLVIVRAVSNGKSETVKIMM